MSETPVTSLTAPAPASTARTAEERTSAPRRAARTLAARAVSSVTTAEARSSTAVAPTPDPRHLAPTVPRQKHLAKKYAVSVAVQATAPAKPKAPEIDDDITGRELDGATFRQLRALEPRNAETVAKHLAMAGRYLDIDPEFALEHAVAASRSAGRIAAVREAVGVAAYVAEDFELALRELRTHRRISGSVDHLALLVDCERALGRLPKAMEMIAEFKKEELPANVRVELAIVESGILSDQGKKSEAVVALQIPQLNPKRAFEYSPRLFSAYSDALANAGRNQEAERWARLAFMAEAALGQGNFAEPEIFDMFGEAGLFEQEEKSVELTETAEEAEETAEEEVAEDEKTEAPKTEEAEETSAE